MPIEEESCRDLPLVWDLYRPIRASAAAILFDFNKRSLIYRNSQKEAKGACVWCVRACVVMGVRNRIIRNVLTDKSHTKIICFFFRRIKDKML